jgi:cytochrome b6
MGIFAFSFISAYHVWYWYLFICMVYDWCEERFEIQSIADDILAKCVPPHVNIFYCFGGIVLTSNRTSFLFQAGSIAGTLPTLPAGSGFSLTIYYQPTAVQFIFFWMHIM